MNDKQTYEPVIGLEVHVQLNTNSKMFCKCEIAPFDSAPNSYVCNICMGYPGTLPLINNKAIEMVAKSGLALNGKINQMTRFDRKNYHYPDLMKGYQISQFKYPIVVGGEVSIKTNQEKIITLNRIHLEEDTAKLTHIKEKSLIDINRSGTPLMEVVSEPEISNAEEARKYLQELHSLFTEIGVTKGNLEQGHFRCDANISLRPKGSKTLGEKVEIKNMNSFRSVFRAINFEIERQSVELNSNNKIIQETRGWNEAKGITVSQRSKESAHDYRYFPDPDLPNIYINDKLLSDLKSSIPELKKDRVKYLNNDYDLNEQVIQLLASDTFLYEYFKNIHKLTQNQNNNVSDQELANWITEEILKILDSNNITTNKIHNTLKSEYVLELIELTNSKTINRNSAREILASLIKTNKPPKDLINDLGLAKISDFGELNELCLQAIKNNPEAVKDYNSGKETAVKFLIGQVMRLSKGKADPNETELNILNILKNE
ncbi:MAG: Asp-tRNA(Asn)/Glu-tRNA(Gln) amidotransferase subunit GatB [Dehalococcoidia bacterium]